MNKIIEITHENFNEWDLLPSHIVQSSIWADFLDAINSPYHLFAEKVDEKITNVWLCEIITKGKIKSGRISECLMPTKELLAFLKTFGKNNNIRYFSFEPTVVDTQNTKEQLKSLGLKKGEDHFLKNTFILDLKKFLTVDQMFTSFSTSTRRNIRIAQKKDVKVNILKYADESSKHLDTFLKIQKETTNRQKFSVHNDSYYKKMYEVFKEKMIICEAIFNNEVIGSIILFNWQDTCYYPYGATLHKYIDTKSTNLLLNEALNFAFENGITYFNFWGALTHNPSPNDPLYGVHMFKKGYGGDLYEYVGAYDLVISPLHYLTAKSGIKGKRHIRKFIRKLKR